VGRRSGNWPGRMTGTSEETYEAALARLIDSHRVLALSRLWGTGTTSSSDGQYYQAGGHGEALGDINAGMATRWVRPSIPTSPTSSARTIPR
jgi:TnpA family transposase